MRTWRLPDTAPLLDPPWPLGDSVVSDDVVDDDVGDDVRGGDVRAVGRSGPACFPLLESGRARAPRISEATVP